jgi:anti-sigma B factor antagonist
VTDLARLTLDLRDGVHVAHILGEVDIANAQGLESEIADAVSNSAEGLVLDLTDTEYFDSAGVRMLFELHGRLSGRRQSLRVVVPPEAVILSALRITEVDQVVPIDGTLEESLAALGAGNG